MKTVLVQIPLITFLCLSGIFKPYINLEQENFVRGNFQYQTIGDKFIYAEEESSKDNGAVVDYDAKNRKTKQILLPKNTEILFYKKYIVTINGEEKVYPEPPANTKITWYDASLDKVREVTATKAYLAGNTGSDTYFNDDNHIFYTAFGPKPDGKGGTYSGIVNYVYDIASDTNKETASENELYAIAYRLNKVVQPEKDGETASLEVGLYLRDYFNTDKDIFLGNAVLKHDNNGNLVSIKTEGASVIKLDYTSGGVNADGSAILHSGENISQSTGFSIPEETYRKLLEEYYNKQK
jgi:hypothetical protein